MHCGAHLCVHAWCGPAVTGAFQPAAAMVKLLVVKILCMVGVFFFMLLGSLLPVKVIETDFEKAHHSKKVLSLCNTFGGGVFLATCFNALLPAVREKVRPLRWAPYGQGALASVSYCCITSHSTWASFIILWLLWVCIWVRPGEVLCFGSHEAAVRTSPGCGWLPRGLKVEMDWLPDPAWVQIAAGCETEELRGRKWSCVPLHQHLSHVTVV